MVKKYDYSRRSKKKRRIVSQCYCEESAFRRKIIKGGFKMNKSIIEKITEKQINPNIPEFRVGDTVNVGCKIAF